MSNVFELSGRMPGDNRTAGGIAVDLRNWPPGTVRLMKMGDHVLKMHVGPSVRGTCELGRRYLYAEGDLDVFPAGMSSVWENEDANTFIFARLPSTLLLQVALPTI
jgi:AraC family transcriptional regulator